MITLPVGSWGDPCKSRVRTLLMEKGTFDLIPEQYAGAGPDHPVGTACSKALRWYWAELLQQPEGLFYWQHARGRDFRSSQAKPAPTGL
jgi:hypothetical protein